MDLNQEGSSESGVVSITTSPASEVAAQRKVCADCQTTRTPLWRSGPAGPRSLCNACGIRHRKQRRALLGLGKGGSEKTKKKKQLVRSNSSNSSSSTVTSSDIEMGGSVNLEIVDVGREMLLQRSSGKKKEKLREEEEAAMLLMALSCGSVFA